MNQFRGHLEQGRRFGAIRTHETHLHRSASDQDALGYLGILLVGLRDTIFGRWQVKRVRAGTPRISGEILKIPIALLALLLLNIQYSN